MKFSKERRLDQTRNSLKFGNQRMNIVSPSARDLRIKHAYAVLGKILISEGQRSALILTPAQYTGKMLKT